MALQLRTFSNIAGSNTLFKALGHPAVAPHARRLVETLSKSGRIAIYDPDGAVAEFAQLYDSVSWEIADVECRCAVRRHIRFEAAPGGDPSVRHAGDAHRHAR